MALPCLTRTLHSSGMLCKSRFTFVFLHSLTYVTTRQVWPVAFRTPSVGLPTTQMLPNGSDARGSGGAFGSST